MKNKPLIFKILKKSFSLYFKNIFRLIEIVAWITLPASIFFVLIFYWGLPQQALYVLGFISYPSAFVLLLLLNAVLIEIIRAMEEGKHLSMLSVYASAFTIFGPYLWVLVLVTLRILLRSLPFVLSCFISFWIRQSGGPLWPFGLSLVFLAPVFMAICYYSFSSLAFLVDGIKGRRALDESKKIIKLHFWKFLRNVLLLGFIMTPLYRQIFSWVDKVQSMPLSPQNLFVLIFLNCSINLLALTVNVFPVVYLYFLYKEFREQHFVSLRGGAS